jgi:hypothetical protein
MHHEVARDLGRPWTGCILNQLLNVNFMLMTSTMNTRWSMTVLSWNRLMKSSFWWRNLHTLTVSCLTSLLLVASLPNFLLLRGILPRL